MVTLYLWRLKFFKHTLKTTHTCTMQRRVTCQGHLQKHLWHTETRYPWQWHNGYIQRQLICLCSVPCLVSVVVCFVYVTIISLAASWACLLKIVLEAVPLVAQTPPKVFAINLEKKSGCEIRDLHYLTSHLLA